MQKEESNQRRKITLFPTGPAQAEPSRRSGSNDEQTHHLNNLAIIEKPTKTTSNGNGVRGGSPDKFGNLAACFSCLVVGVKRVAGKNVVLPYTLCPQSAFFGSFLFFFHRKKKKRNERSKIIQNKIR